MGLSILQDEKVCYLCGCERNLELHHIFGGVANRPLSQRYGLVVWLCAKCHRGIDGAQYCKEVNLRLKQEAQRAFVARHGTEEWMKLFKKNYTGVWHDEPNGEDP